MTIAYFQGVTARPHRFTVPLDHARPTGETIQVFGREIVSTIKEQENLPWLVFLQGGPGFGSPRPTDGNGWLKRALQEYRVLLLDQRGTGLSTPITHQTLARFASAFEIAEYLKHFRADAIVQDAELIRKQLAGEQTRWSLLGQSYGGFCAVHYLSIAPQSLREVYITGGLPSLYRHADEVYRATYRRVKDKNALYFSNYPDDRERAHEVIQYLRQHLVTMPAGGTLSPFRFQQLGMGLGASGSFEELHYLLEGAFVDGPQGRELNYAFLRGVENTQPFDTNPIYAILHESIYCQEFASNWSAERVRAEYPEFDPLQQPILFTGEMIYPWMFEDYASLRPMHEAAQQLAEFEGWPRLYDIPTLQANTVPCVAAIYANDMYVERRFSEETASDIRGIKTWVTSEYEHNGLRADGETVFGQLIALLREEEAMG
jgi:pimeloyl-ACP methyl ester carboxylesterase